MAAQIFSAIFVIIVGVGGCVAYFWGANKLVDIIFPSRGVAGAAAIDNLRRQGQVRPWLFVGPAMSGPGVQMNVSCSLRATSLVLERWR